MKAILRSGFLALVLLIAALIAEKAEAKIIALRCSFENIKNLYFTLYDDGTPARVGVSVGIGNRARTVFDRISGSMVVIEVNTDDIPITMTSISPDLSAVHSRHMLDVLGVVQAPSQGWGKCEPVPLE